MNVLSVFDGISCGQLALNKAGIFYKNYYASEIDKYAIQVTQSNFPGTIQLGDITNLNKSNLPKIDLLIGGSPCQSFSIAGNKTGFDGKSKLFWEFARLLKELNPTYFLLENVKMKHEWERVITNELKVTPILIDSSLVSGQNRRRLYWTNIPHISQPIDKKINLSDILEINYVDGLNIKSFYDTNAIKLIKKSENKKDIFVNTDIYPPYTFYETRTEEGKKNRREVRQLTGIDTTPRNAQSKMYLSVKHNKANCVLATENFLNTIVDKDYNLRKLTTLERERLQTIPDNYTKIVNNSQANKLIGNGWTVDIVAHIFSFLEQK